MKFALLSRVPLPTLDEAYNTMAQDEEYKATSRLLDERYEGVSFVVQTQPRNITSDENRNKSGSCSTYGRTRHLAEQYFRKIEYPP